MLISFSVENYRSIYNKVQLSFEATTGIKDVTITGGVTTSGNVQVLNSVALYGANSCGKTNLLKAIARMRFMILSSVKLNNEEPLPYDPFLLIKGNDKPTTFSCVFLMDEDKYSYSFTYNRTSILSETLFLKRPRLSEKCLLSRNADGIKIDEKYFAEGSPIQNSTIAINNNRLFVSLAAQIGGSVSQKIIEFFTKHITVLSGIDDNIFTGRTKRILHEGSMLKDDILSFLYGMKLGIGELSTRMMDISEMNLPIGLPAEIIEKIKDNPQISVMSSHTVYGNNGEVSGVLQFDLEERESAGTNKLFNLAGPIAQALHYGTILCIDELDSQLHPLISRQLITMFNDEKTNSHGAQLIFSTHDTSLMNSKLFRRDQICLVEKDMRESTSVKSLLDVVLPNGHRPRTDSNYEKNYLDGNYEAIPEL